MSARIEPADGDAGDDDILLFRASPAQQRLWLLEGLDGATGQDYLIHGALRLRGELSVRALEQALGECLALHESLRTSFIEIDGTPWQAVETGLRAPLLLHDLRALPTAERLPAALRLIGEMTATPFDLRRPPLLRVQLLRLGRTDWVLALCIHHIICDGPSLGRMLADLSTAYAHALDPASPRPRPPRVQMADFAEWQCEQRDTPAMRQRLAFWQAHLRDVPDLRPPLDHARPARRAARGARVQFAIDAALRARVERAAQAAKVTPFVVLLGAWGMTLARWSGQHDFAIGTPVAADNQPALDDAVGFFAETIALRFRADDDPDAATLWARTGNHWRELLAHAGVPFDLLLQGLGRGLARDRTPLFQTMFSLNPALSVPPLPGLSAEPFGLPLAQAKTDLVLELDESDDAYRAVLEYDAALFEPASATRLAEHFVQLLGAALDDPRRRLGELPAGPRPHAARWLAPAKANETAVPAATDTARVALHDSVLQVWRELLGEVPIDADSDFFLIGGHSLLAAKAVTRLRQRLGFPIAVDVLFDAPVLSQLVDALAALQAAPREPVPVPTAPEMAAEAWPLSPAQARLWFVQRMEPSNTAYNLCAAALIEGELRVDALTEALDLLQQRQHSLRTRFIERNGVPLQQVMPAVGVTLAAQSLEHLDSAAQNAALRRLAREESARPFDLSEAPPLRVRLLRLASERHVFSLCLHHIIADGWSLDLLWRELGALYLAVRAGRPAALPALTMQYPDYARWQLAHLADAAQGRHLEAWRHDLAGLPVLELAIDRPRLAQPGSAGAQWEFALTPTAITALNTLARAAGVTRFVASLTAFAALLGRWSGQSDFAIGVPVAGREHDDTHDLIGCFINMLPIRAELAGAVDFAGLARAMQRRCRDAFARQSLPFERLLEALRPAADLDRHPLFQVLFNYQHSDIHTTAVDGLRIQPLELPVDTAQFDLAVHLVDTADDLRCRFVYRSELFETATIERLAYGYRALLDACAEPAAAWADVELASVADRQRLADWNATAVDYGAAAPLDTLIAEQAARTPMATAVSADDGRLDFAQLLARANALATQLRELGVVPGQLVAVHLPRGVDLPMALLAVLRAGCAYLPLDPELPTERLRFMLEDAAPVAMIATAGPRDWLPSNLPVLPPTATPADVATPALAPRDPDDIAYVIYTSGSTGKPKGVMVSHRAIVNRLRWMQAQYRLGPDDRVLQKTPCGFDVSVWEFFWPMLGGAELVMARPGGHRDPDYLARTIEDKRISVAHFVPSMLEIFLATAQLRRAASLRLLFTSGEALSPTLRDRCLDGLPGTAVHNLYGPTEAAVDVTCWPCTVEQRGEPVPIGRPLANTRIHVLDRHGHATPIGVPGEICIAGVQVARGYLNRPELDAQRFVADPFSAEPGARMYRSGDLGRWRDGGWIEYLGRDDHQVKLRGQRIELGEIEATLREHATVRDAAVLLLGEGLHARLEGFVLAGADAPDGAVLRAWLGQRLAAAMVPTRIHTLASFPLTLSGKTDRRALAALAPTVAPPAEALIASEASRRRVTAIWCEVLGLEQVDAHANFFEAGGNSLLLVQVHARLKRDFANPPSLLELFRLPTVAALAAHLDGQREAMIIEVAPAAIDANEPIAIVGMAGRFPGADSVEQLWRQLLEGRSGIRQVSREEALGDGADPALLDHPAYVPYAAPLQGIEQFDEGLFGYSPADAALLDPQGRWLLQCAWEALEQAAIDPRRANGSIGVFAGSTVSSYALHALRDRQLDQTLAQRVLFANDKDYVASRIAYKLGLDGPAIGVQTACSSSLVAVALAVDALRRGDCAVALAGGASIEVPHRVGYLYEEGSILSPDGYCRAFDARAGGTVGGNGVAMVVLKRLSSALADGDPIRAVIRGIAINNDGADKLGFSAPSAVGQERVLRAALAKAGVGAEQIGYVEAHGTGTRLGDEVELSALGAAYATAAPRAAPCRLGSLKSNIGHLDAAAGVAGLIKAALAVERGMLPPTLHVNAPNPRLRDVAAGFELVTTLTPWHQPDGPRRAGVSSFGIGGTNAHCIVEQPPARATTPHSGRAQLLTLSAADPAALARQRQHLLVALEAESAPALEALAWTLQRGRRALPWRQAFVVDDLAQARQCLTGASAPAKPAAEPAVYLLFPGQRGQSLAMGAQLYAEETLFRAEVERCVALLPTPLAERMLSGCFGHHGGCAELTQPALFILEYALAHWLIGLGLAPSGLLGHGLGELSAATIAGVLALPDALQLVVARSRLPPEPAQALGKTLAELATAAPSIPLLSNLSGDWMDAAEALDASRWIRQIEQPARFADCLRRLAERDPHALLLEVGAGRTLSAFAGAVELSYLALLPNVAEAPGGARRGLLQALGDAWQAGVAIDWRGLYGEQPPTPLPLPSYPFADNVHWLRAADDAGAHLALIEWRRAARPSRDPTITRMALYGGEPTQAGALADRLREAGLAIRRLTNLADADADERLVVLDPRFEDVLELARQLGGKPPHSLLLVSHGAQDDGADADAAMATAAALALAQELPELRLRHVDLAGADDPRQLAALCEECLADAPAAVLLRDGRRRLPRVQRLPATSAASAWREGAVVLITGGYGQLGLRFAHHLAQRGGARLVLLGRHALAEDDPRLRALREQGAELLLLEGDIAGAGVAERAVRAAHERFGALHVVIHAAGVAGEAALHPLLETSLSESMDVWKSKCEGTIRLAEAVAELPLDHVLLCSSVASVLGGLGFAAYAAGNRWMEVYAEARSRRGGTPWLALAYDGLHDEQTAPSPLALDRRQTMALTEQALAAGLDGRVLALAGDLEGRLSRWASPLATTADLSARQNLRATIAESYADPLQAQVALAWAEVLGLARLGPDEDFFALGGDSLVATRLVAQLRAATGLPLSVGLVLRAPTVRLLAATIATLRGDDAASGACDEELEEGSL